MKRFKLIDNALGVLVFIIAATVYCLTIEPTASFWDCPEFITTGYKLEVGHPPGAPFFMLTANLFSLFASDTTQVAAMVNTMSAIFSALTILFLFWTISHLVRKLIVRGNENFTLAKIIAIEGSAITGALIYTFSDTFWFSAVEGEVYAYSSLFTAVVFWLILKWEDHADEPHSDRWLVLIAYVTGLSVGVHLLNLLCLPAIILVYYYRRFPHIDAKSDVKGSILALILSFIILAVVLYGVVPGIVQVGGVFELFFVNILGCPFNTGVVVYIVLLVATIIWAIRETYTNKSDKRGTIAFLFAVAMLGIPFYGHGLSALIIGLILLALLGTILLYKRKNSQPIITSRIKNTALLCLLMLMIGYSSYALIVIRSSANPPMDQNSPEDIFTLGQYLSREQYGTRPLFYGPAYSSQIALEREGNYCRAKLNKGENIYQRKDKASDEEKDSYFVVRTNDSYAYAQNMLFPRMYDSAHKADYEAWMGTIDTYSEPYDRCGEMISVKIPTQAENLRFFLTYQCNWMYWRYFMWNFVGRQNDIQGHGEPEHGNWISGIKWIDNLRLGDQDLLPNELKTNKGHNVFYFLPLLLGILGLIWQACRREIDGIRQFWVVFFLFFMTGLAIVVYLNQTPVQPRERDYAYAGSFYAFAIWCGMGVMALITLLKKVIKNPTLVSSVVSICCILVPIQMASQTWDDHDRSGRYTCRDFGQNYLMSLQRENNPIIYTNGDNDTFPLWYNQDTEGVRTDARVCNLSYLQTDWYIDQMKRPAYDSPSVPIEWSRLEYCAGTNDYITVDKSVGDYVRKIYEANPDYAKKMLGEDPFELANVLKYWVRQDLNDAQKDFMQRLSDYVGSPVHVIPTDTLYLTIDKDAVRSSGMLMVSDSIPDRMIISLKGKGALYKNDLMMLEMVSTCNWTRPIYVARTVGPNNYMNLGENFVQEGLAYRITPFYTKAPGVKSFDTERSYDNMMNYFKFGGIDRPGIYLDETVMRMCYTHRSVFIQLVTALLEEGKTKKAKQVLEYLDKNIPYYNVPADFSSGSLEELEAYTVLKDTTNATNLAQMLWEKSSEYAEWYLNQSDKRFRSCRQDCYLHLYVMQKVSEFVTQFDTDLAKEMASDLANYTGIFSKRGGFLK